MHRPGEHSADLADIAVKLVEENKRLAALLASRDAALATIHDKTRRVTLYEEKILGGIRYAPGVYALMRIGDIDQGEKLEF